MTAQKKLITLDILRGIACLLVWINHIRVATKYFEDSKYDFMQVFSAWGHEAVLIFFILSGIVINLTSQNKTDVKAYFKKRFIRIYPIYFIILLFCFLSDYFIYKNPIDTKTFIVNLFLSATNDGFLGHSMPLNPAVWTISCEVFYYTVFGLFYNYNRVKGIWIWFAICCLSILYKIYDHQTQTGLFYHLLFLLNNSFFWILGYLVFEYRNKIYTTFPVAICGLLMVPMVTRLHQLTSTTELVFSLAGIYLLPLFIFLLRNYKTTPEVKRKINYLYLAPFYLLSLFLLWNYSNSLFGSKIIYSLIPFSSLIFYYPPVMAALIGVYSFLKRFFLFLADISYPLYLVHFPVMYLVYFFLPGQKAIGMLLVVIFVISLSYLLETFLFKKLSAIANKSQ